MKGPRNVLAKQKRGRQRQPLKVGDWYTAPRAGEVARRSEVWGLLRWYHETWVQPHRGVRGMIRRMWWRLTRQHQRLLSPWEQLDARMAVLAERRAADLEEEARQLEAARSNGAVAP